MIYADTSFFVSVYVEDRHSAETDKRLASDPQIWPTPLHLAEFTHAIAQQVFRRQMSAAEAERVYRELEVDRVSDLWQEIAIPEKAFPLCADLARRHGPKLGVHTLNSLHVALALELKAEQFWTFDERHAKLAKAVGLKIS